MARQVIRSIVSTTCSPLMPWSTSIARASRVLASNLGLLDGRASYQTLLGKASVGVSYARVNYELGREFKSLDAHGSADIFNLFGS